MSQLLKGVSLIRRDLTEVDGGDALEGKVVALYFSAGWCPPCRQFTPKLVRFHEAMKAAGKPFEVVFVSRDRAKADLEEYFSEKHGDWLSLQYGDDRIQKFQSKFEIKTIPILRVIKSDGTMAVVDGRADINERAKETKDALALFEKWQKLCT